MDKKTKIIKFAMYIPLALLILAYAQHSAEGLLGSDEYREIISVIGFSAAITSLLALFIGLWDGAIALMLLLRPGKWMFLLAGLWPWVPRVLEFMGGREIEVVDAVVMTSIAALAYYFHIRLQKMHDMQMPLVTKKEV